MGELIGDEPSIMPFIDQASIACGGHIGDEKSILQTLTLAKDYNVEIGIHPSYPDKINFGRKSIPWDEHVEDELKRQFDLFLNCADKIGINTSYIKPHGALYNDISADKTIREKFTQLILAYPIRRLMLAYHLNIDEPFQPIREVFGDRRYIDAYHLQSRVSKGALIQGTTAFQYHIDHLLNGKLVDVNGGIHIIQADSICIHSDHPKSLQFVKILRRKIHD